MPGRRHQDRRDRSITRTPIGRAYRGAFNNTSAPRLFGILDHWRSAINDQPSMMFF
jgi:hypothetical protein